MTQARKEDVPSGRLLLTLSAFQAIAAKLIGERDPRDEILRAFALFDTDDKGMISLDDLRRVARELGEGLEEDELNAMIEEFDLEGKGGVGREEFVGICMG
jgi:centrin-3